MNHLLPSTEPSGTERQLSTVVAAITGALSDPSANLTQTVSNVIQRGLQGELMKGFKESWDYLVDKGRIKPDYLNTIHGMATFRELVKALDLDDTESVRFEAVQNIFLNDALSDEDKNEVLVTRFIRIAASLSPSEILILKAIKEDPELEDDDDTSEESWLTDLAIATGLNHKELVKSDVASLQSKQLLIRIDPLSITMLSHGLTSLGDELCEYMMDPKKD